MEYELQELELQKLPDPPPLINNFRDLEFAPINLPFQFYNPGGAK